MCIRYFFLRNLSLTSLASNLAHSRLSVGYLHQGHSSGRGEFHHTDVHIRLALGVSGNLFSYGLVVVYIVAFVCIRIVAVVLGFPKQWPIVRWAV